MMQNKPNQLLAGPFFFTGMVGCIFAASSFPFNDLQTACLFVVIVATVAGTMWVYGEHQ